MIEKHFNLMCYTLQDPFTAYYSVNKQEYVSFCDNNNDIYQFNLSDIDQYEKIHQQNQLKLLLRIADLRLHLDIKGNFTARCSGQLISKYNDIAEMEVLQISKIIYIILRSNSFYHETQMQLIIGIIDLSKNEMKNIDFESYTLEQQYEQGHMKINKSQALYKIQKLMNRCSCIGNSLGQKYIIRINFEKINKQQKILKYERLQFELSQELRTINSFGDSILAKMNDSIYLIDGINQKVVMLHHSHPDKLISYILYNNFIVTIVENNFIIHETIKGSKMAQINIDTMLEQFQEGSSIVIKQQPKLQFRYCLLFDQLKNKISHFYLLDRQKLALYYFNINKLLERGFIKTTKQNLKDLEEDSQKYHQNVMKTMSFRMKKLENLEKYLLEDLKINNFNNSLRFLMNEQTIYVLNDGLILFYHAVTSNLAQIIKNKQLFLQLQREIVKICHRLITESNYQNQIANGLQTLNAVYTNFRKCDNSEYLQKNKDVYSKILQTSRVNKLLKNDKKKKLFELSYELALKIKGYKYLESIQSKNK